MEIVNSPEWCLYLDKNLIERAQSKSQITCILKLLGDPRQVNKADKIRLLTKAVEIIFNISFWFYEDCHILTWKLGRLEQICKFKTNFSK